MTMTPDQCFDEMAVALGVPTDTGYIKLLDLVKKLKEENEELKAENDYLDTYEKQKSYDENKKLKELCMSMCQQLEDATEHEVKDPDHYYRGIQAVKELKADDKYQQGIISKYSEENDMWHRLNDELTEENEKLKEELIKEKKKSVELMEEKIKKLKEEKAEWIKYSNEWIENEKLKEENKKLKEQLNETDKP